MKRALVLVCLFGGAATAAPHITAPTGWVPDSKRAAELAVAVVGHFGGGPATTQAEVYAPPGPNAGIELVVTRATAPIKPADRAAAARAEVDELHAMSRRAAMSGSNVTEDAWSEHADSVAHLVEAALSFRDGSAKVIEHARLLIAGDDKALVATTGECIARDDVVPSLVAACKASLDTLDLALDPSVRVALELAPTGTAPDPGAPTGSQPSMSDSSHVPLPPISVPQETPSADRRPVFVGLGIVLLAAVFWWNTRRRARLEEEDAADAKKDDKKVDP